MTAGVKECSEGPCHAQQQLFFRYIFHNIWRMENAREEELTTCAHLPALEMRRNEVCQKEQLHHISINPACLPALSALAPCLQKSDWPGSSFPSQSLIRVCYPSHHCLRCYLLACVWPGSEYKWMWRVHREKPVTLISPIWFPVFLALVWPQMSILSSSLLIKKRNHLFPQFCKLNILSK